MSLPKLSVLNKKQDSILRRHPWVFSGALTNDIPEIEDGALVELHNQSGAYLATGIYQKEGSISVRIIDFEQHEINADFWFNKLSNALKTRENLGLIKAEFNTIYRLVHGEGDGLPGLIIDVYADVAVVQCHAYGMYLQKEAIAQALQAVYGKNLVSIYDKSAETLPKAIAHLATNGLLWGDEKHKVIAFENGCKFAIDWISGQKTGFFIDQRVNRELLGSYSKNKKVLNTFCYSGGFSVYALLQGASEVHSLDSSQKALDLVSENISINSLENHPHKIIKADAIDFMKDFATDYDIIVLDPPAFAKSIKSRHKALQAYKRLNEQAIKHIQPGGLIFTFSCSAVVDKAMFTGAVMAASIACGRQIRILNQLHQPADHPISIYHPEGEYLKGLVIQVD